MAPNFTACAAKFLENPVLYLNYTYTGPVQGIFRDGNGRPPMLTLEGCYDLCGTGSQYYPWSQASTTILTWFFPLLAMLTKAPFESLQTKRTILVMCKWFGSPIASLAYIFWNIKVQGRAAMMVDMASPYNEVPGPDSDFADFRDSMYILSIMNQYNIRAGVPSVEGEKLLRIALFSDTLKLAHTERDRETLPMRRKTLAYRLRAGRKRGLVPIFFSAFWWVFAMCVSIENAFGQIGTNATAHNLAIGLMFSWFPVLVFACVVDRIPFATPEVRIRLNNLLDAVRLALLDDDLRNTYMRQEGRTLDDFRWTTVLRRENFMGTTGFFTGFAGQGRGRWHYGVAHPIITGIEEAYAARRGRGWLGTSDLEKWHSRTACVTGPEHGNALEGLRYFDMREFWEVLFASLVVTGTVFGAFTISYFTPTQGLGCRSGGYTIFFVIAISTAVFEALTWWWLPEGVAPSLRPQPVSSNSGFVSHWIYKIKIAYRYDPRYIADVALLRPLEMANTIWLFYCVFAQAVGSYNSCSCKASNWAGQGGYMNFASPQYYKDHGITVYWATGTTVALFCMCTAIVYIIIEWCTQSHLCTENYAAAARGLRRTRTFKKYTRPFRMPIEGLVTLVRLMYNTRCGVRMGNRGRRSLVWSWRMNSETIAANAVDEKGSAFHENPHVSAKMGDGQQTHVREVSVDEQDSPVYEKPEVSTESSSGEQTEIHGASGEPSAKPFRWSSLAEVRTERTD